MSIDGVKIKEIKNNNLTIDDVELDDKKWRKPNGLPFLLLEGVCFAMAFFHMYEAGFGKIPLNIFRATHLGFGLCIAFLMYPATKKSSKNKIPWYDYLLSILALIPNMYIVLEFKNIIMRGGRVITTDVIMGIILIIVLIEAARRVVGPILTGIAVFFLFYILFGRYFPGQLSFRGVTLQGLVRQMYLSTEGIYGVALGVSAKFVFLFILLGSILNYIGAGDALINISLALLGKQRGGPAKVAVFSSALFGTVSGSALANVIATGTFTIPLMKKTGYKPYFAASVEATASIGGQLMPPVMGAAAFIIAEFLGISYLSVCLAAFFPALLYFLSIFFAVDQEAVRLGLKGLPSDQIPNKIEFLKKESYLLLPLASIIFILIFGYSASMAAFYSILIGIFLSFFKPKTRLTPLQLFFCFSAGAKNVIEVLVACAIVGIIVGSFIISGMGMKFASIVLIISRGSLFFTLLFTALASLVLGMGVPTTANYIMMSMITVPALVSMGVFPLAAHLFCFYYGIISDITPPVALAALTGAGIAKADFFQTAINATKLGFVAYIVPFFFVYNNSLLLGTTKFSFISILILFFSIIGVFILSCAMYNYIIDYMKPYERLGVFISGLIMIYPEIFTSFIGLIIFILIWWNQKRKNIESNKI